GDFVPDEAEQMVHRYFDDIRSSATPRVRLAPSRARVHGERRASAQTSTVGEGVLLAWPAPLHGSPDYHALSVLAWCISDSRSPLRQRLLSLDARLSRLRASQLDLHSESLFVIDAVLTRGADLSYVRQVIGWEIDKMRANVAGYCRLASLKQRWLAG